MSFDEPVLGSKNENQINKNETFSKPITYKNTAGDPVSLAGATITIIESEPPSIIDDVSFTITGDGTAGLATMVISAANMAKLGLGRVNWFRMKTVFSGANDDDVTPPVWIEVT